MIEDELIKVNKSLTKLRYEFDQYNTDETKEILDLLQYHIFLVITYLTKTEFDLNEVKEKLLEKINSGKE